MSEPTVVEITDQDILENIHKFVRNYKPLKTAPKTVQFTVQNGVITIQGHILSSATRRLLLANLVDIPGFVALDDSKLYDDETLRLELGKLLPDGVWLRVYYGTVYLGGCLPSKTSVNELKSRIAEVSGVREVIVDLK